MTWQKQDVVKRLPEKVQSLLKEVETWSALDVTITSNPNPPDPNDPFPEGPATRFSHDSAAIYLRSADSDPHGILHELLHLKRYWIEQIPALTTTSDIAGNKRITDQLDNELEHLVIVPLEANYGFEPFEHWNQIEESHWTKYPWPDATATFVRRRFCLMRWLSANMLVTREPVRDMARDCLVREGIWGEAEAFRKKVLRVLSHKPSLASAAVRFLGLPHGDIALKQFDVRNRRLVYHPIPPC